MTYQGQVTVIPLRLPGPIAAHRTLGSVAGTFDTVQLADGRVTWQSSRLACEAVREMLAT